MNHLFTSIENQFPASLHFLWNFETKLKTKKTRADHFLVFYIELLNPVEKEKKKAIGRFACYTSSSHLYTTCLAFFFFMNTFFLYNLGCPGQLTRTTTNPRTHWTPCKPNRQVRHRGGDRRVMLWFNIKAWSMLVMLNHVCFLHNNHWSFE